MSQVFRYEQILELPLVDAKQEDFDNGIAIARDHLQDLVDKGLVVGALFFGSATFKGTNPCSDIDTFAVVKAFDEETVAGLQKTVQDVNTKAGTSLELTTYTLDQLRTGQHWERAAKADWLHKQAQDNPELIIGSDPTVFISPLSKDVRVDVDEYLTNRAQEMTWLQIHGFQRQPELTLEKIFNTPHRTARKTLNVLSFVGYLPIDTLPDMRKSTIATATNSVYGSHDMLIVAHQDDIQDDFTRYIGLIGEVRSGQVSALEYYQLLHATIAEDLPKAIDFTRRIQKQYRTLAKLAIQD